MNKDTANITQAEAFRRLAVTGLSERSRLGMIAAMPKVTDGKRQKVSAKHVADLIDRHSLPPMEEKSHTIRPLSVAHRRKFKAIAEVDRVVNQAREQARRAAAG